MLWIKSHEKMKLKEVLEILEQLKLPIGFASTPENLFSEREKVFKDPHYNPQFEYNDLDIDNKVVFKNLKSLKEIVDVDPRVSEFIVELISDKHLSDKLIKAIGENEKFTSLSIEKYGFPTEIMHRNANRIIRGKNSKYKLSKLVENHKPYQYEEVGRIIRTFLEYFGLTDWKVEDSEIKASNKISMGVKSKEIYLGESVTRKDYNLKRALIHEVGTHVFRSVNGEKAGFHFLSKANLDRYIDTEEGLAIYNYEKYGYLTKKKLRGIARIVTLIYQARESSFSDLYIALKELIGEKKAFNKIYRIKKGLSDTSYPGVFTKDLAYYRGFKKVRKAVANDESLYNKLYAGKIPLDLVSWVDDGLIPMPKLVLNRKDLDNAFIKCGL